MNKLLIAAVAAAVSLASTSVSFAQATAKTERPKAAATCVYDGKQYSEGAVYCMPSKKGVRCNARGGWNDAENADNSKVYCGS